MWKEVSTNLTLTLNIEPNDAYLKALGEEKDMDEVGKNDVDDTNESPNINLG